MIEKSHTDTDAQACAVRLEARPADNSKEWTEIFPAQLEWVAKEGHQVRAIELAAQPPAAPVETAVAWRVHYCGQWLYFETEAAAEIYAHSNCKAEPLYNFESQAKEPEASGGLCQAASHAVRVGEASADLPTTSEIMDVTAGRDRQPHNGCSAASGHEPQHDHRVYFACECCEAYEPENSVSCRSDVAVMPDGTWLCDNCYSECDKTAYGIVCCDVDDFEYPRFEDLPRPAPYPVQSVPANEPQQLPVPWESLTAIIRPMIESVCSDGNSDAARLAKDIADRILASLSLTRPHGGSAE